MAQVEWAIDIKIKISKVHFCDKLTFCASAAGNKYIKLNIMFVLLSFSYSKSKKLKCKIEKSLPLTSTSH